MRVGSASGPFTGLPHALPLDRLDPLGPQLLSQSSHLCVLGVASKRVDREVAVAIELVAEIAGIQPVDAEELGVQLRARGQPRIVDAVARPDIAFVVEIQRDDLLGAQCVEQDRRVGAGHELQARERVLQRANEARLPGGVQVEIELVDEHQALHVLGLDLRDVVAAEVQEDLADQIGQPRQAGLVAVRQPRGGELDRARREGLLEAVAIVEIGRALDPSATAQLHVSDVGDEIGGGGEDAAEDPAEATGVLGGEEVGEPQADERGGAEQRDQAVVAGLADLALVVAHREVA